MIVNQEKTIFDISVDKSEVLRYLGHNGQDIDSDLDFKINECIEETKENIDIKYVYDIYDIKNDLASHTIEFKNTTLKLQSKDLSELLEDCDKCVLMSATLGFNIEKNIRKYSYKNLTKGVIIDACATTSIEEVCDMVQDSILQTVAKEKKSLTMRYSPGYGDLDIRANKNILNVLNAQRKIGVTVTDTGIMIPRKSVVALIGITNKQIKKVKRTCNNCPNRDNCEFRRKAEGCGNKKIYKG
ncbi:vitamin B12 dependent-methionine synthase activation domain-containing protein [Intestinibacter sp.]|uniref:vitamin B12 dependent-methionine synthase activation domain-containing protein n=1 Tax=Intestinibacter sp. TaxID=1965304 RepID=UPI002A756ACF|nr:vitamin B12 dependent-methionine synthase activation domain-containing protein [Intestinibacter sp.]MDY2737992.1 vitamin B12 dependent-methionine synthase activation domain-containing protein [Intestinibacter sp.]